MHPACILAVAHLVITLDPTAPAAPPALVPLGLAGYVLPLGTNALATGLIAARLLLASRRPQVDSTVGGGGALTARAARRAVAIIVESGALYLAAQLAFVVLFARGAPAQAVAAVIAAQIYVRPPFPSSLAMFSPLFCVTDGRLTSARQGIAPTLMVMQVALGFTLSRDAPGSGSGSGGGTGGGRESGD